MTIARKTRALLVGIALAGVPLITTASCNSQRGAFDFFRDDDHGGHGFVDVFIDDGFYYDDCFFVDCYYDDFYYDEIIIYD